MHTSVDTVAQHMSRPVAVISPEAPLESACDRLHVMSCLVVTSSEGAPLGLLSRSDYLRAARMRATMADSKKLLIVPRVPVGQRMTTQLVSAQRHEALAAAAA